MSCSLTKVANFSPRSYKVGEKYLFSVFLLPALTVGRQLSSSPECALTDTMGKRLIAGF